MQISALIVDDEELARENLSMLLEEHCPQVDVIGKAGSVKEARAFLEGNEPEVIFLDIRMPSGAEGFDLLDDLSDKRSLVVFVTAFKDHAVRAFNANALHYLLKPVDIEELKTAVEKVVNTSAQMKASPSLFSDYFTALQTLSGDLRSDRPLQQITIQHAKGFKIVQVEEILRLEASSNCTMLWFTDGSKFLDTRTMKVYEDLLDTYQFLRIHRSHMINRSALREYLREDGGHYAVLSNGDRIPIARNRVQEFIQEVKGAEPLDPS